MSLKAAPPPMSIRAAASVPFSLKASMPKTKDSAIHSPPATTMGSI